MEEKIYKIIMALIIGFVVTVVAGIIGITISWRSYLYAPVVESTTSINGDSNVANSLLDTSNIVEEEQE